MWNHWVLLAHVAEVEEALVCTTAHFETDHPPEGQLNIHAVARAARAEAEEEDAGAAGKRRAHGPLRHRVEDLRASNAFSGSFGDTGSFTFRKLIAIDFTDRCLIFSSINYSQLQLFSLPNIANFPDVCQAFAPSTNILLNFIPYKGTSHILFEIIWHINKTSDEIFN